MALKFFRRHRKWFMILVIIAAVLMVFWLAIRDMATKIAIWWENPGGEVVGTVDGRDVTARELREVGLGIQASGTAVEVWARALYPSAATEDLQRRIVAETVAQSAWGTLSRNLKDPEHIDRRSAMVWVALLEEAHRLGFDTPESAVHARLGRLRDLGLTHAMLARTVADFAGNSQSLLILGMRHDMTLAAYLQYLYGLFDVAVAPEIRQAFAEQDERIKVLLAVLKAEALVPDVGMPAEDALREQFNQYKSYLPGQGPGGFGYRIPPKVAIEYLVADPAAFENEAAKTVSADDVKQYYETHKATEFVIEPPAEEKGGTEAEQPAAETDATTPEAGATGATEDEAGASPATPVGPRADTGETGATATAPAAESAPAAEAEAKPSEPTYRPFDEVREAIRKQLVRKAAEQLAHEHLAGCVGDITTKRKGIDLRIWADGTRVRYGNVPDLHTQKELAAIPGLGEATRGQVTLPEAALQVVELVGPEKARVAQGEISEVYRGPGGESYAFRVTKVVKSREPESLDEVRQQVLADVRKIKAFRLARDRAKALLEAAAKDGLQKAAEARHIKTVETDWFPRQQYIPYGGRWLSFPPALPEVGSSPLVIAECFKMLKEGRQRTLVTLSDERMVVVAQLVDRKAPREAAYEQWQPLVASRVASRLAAEGLHDVLDPDAVVRRMKVVVKEPKPEPSEKGGETDAAPAETPSGTDEASAAPSGPLGVTGALGRLCPQGGLDSRRAEEYSVGARSGG